MNKRFSAHACQPYCPRFLAMGKSKKGTCDGHLYLHFFGGGHSCFNNAVYIGIIAVIYVREPTQLGRTYTVRENLHG